jgi:nucleotide-binding universal stress UspA family protein
MLQSMVVGLDGSVYSTRAVEFGICWARHWNAVLVGLGVVDAPAIYNAPPVFGVDLYKDDKEQRDTRRLADAHRTVAQLLEHYTQRCTDAGVTYQVRQEVGSPAECLLLDAQEYDLMVLGQQTFFHFDTQDKPDDTLSVVVKQSPCPVIAVPATLPEGQTVIVAYDGSAHATRALHVFQALGLSVAYDVHVVCVDAQQQRAACWAAHAVAFLHGHHIAAQTHVLVTSESPAHVLLEHVHHLQASLLVMGAYGRSTLREFLGHSVTYTLLQESPAPLFLYH